MEQMNGRKPSPLTMALSPSFIITVSLYSIASSFSNTHAIRDPISTKSNQPQTDDQPNLFSIQLKPPDSSQLVTCGIPTSFSFQRQSTELQICSHSLPLNWCKGWATNFYPSQPLSPGIHRRLDESCISSLISSIHLNATIESRTFNVEKNWQTPRLKQFTWLIFS